MTPRQRGLLEVDLPDMVQSAEDELALARAERGSSPLIVLLHLGAALEYLSTAKQFVREIEKGLR